MENLEHVKGIMMMEIVCLWTYYRHCIPFLPGWIWNHLFGEAHKEIEVFKRHRGDNWFLCIGKIYDFGYLDSLQGKNLLFWIFRFSARQEVQTLRFVLGCQCEMCFKTDSEDLNYYVINGRALLGYQSYPTKKTLTAHYLPQSLDFSYSLCTQP